MAEKSSVKKETNKETNTNEEKSVVIGIGFCGGGAGSNTSVADIKNGKIVRIRPLHFDWKYDPKTFNAWTIEARGKTFQPRLKSLIPPYSQGYKKRIYSSNRILYPLKRVDWDPNGERNTQNRGKSKYERISWDKATSLIASEIKRIQAKYGPFAIFPQWGGHGEVKVVHNAHGAPGNLFNLMGGSTTEIRNPDSWEGWYWGAKHVWGMEPVGQMSPAMNCIPDIAKHSGMVLYWGCDPETTPWGFDGQTASRVCYWFNELGIKQVYVCPDLNYGAAVHADKWIPVRPGTDAALHLGIAYTWITEGTYDKEYLKTHSVGFDKFADYVLGKEDGIPKTPAWAETKCQIPEWTIKALARQWAGQATSITHGNGGPGIRSPYSTENARLEACLLGMQGVGKPGVHQMKWIEWWDNIMGHQNPMPQGKIYPNILGATLSIGEGKMDMASLAAKKEGPPGPPDGGPPGGPQMSGPSYGPIGARKGGPPMGESRGTWKTSQTNEGSTAAVSNVCEFKTAHSEKHGYRVPP